MSRAEFEGLVDDLSAELLTVDFGTQESLAQTLLQTEAIVTFLESDGRHDLAVPAQKVVSALRASAAKRGLTTQAKRTVIGQLERLTQLWYDAARSWKDATPAAGLNKLELSEAADPALLAEFIANARLTAEDLESLIDQIRGGSVEAVARLRRLIHTLKGESGMLGLDALAQLLHATESYLDYPVATWNRAEQLLLVRDWMLDALAAYEKGLLPASSARTLIHDLGRAEPAESSSPPPPALTEEDGSRVTQMCAAPLDASATSDSAKAPQPQAQPLPPKVPAPIAAPISSPPSVPSVTWDEQELELVAEFLHESQEATNTIDQILLEIEKEGPDSERINRLFRAFHTLKGVASFLRLNQIVALTHNAETMLDMVRSGKLVATTGVIDLVFDATTLLRSLLAAVESSAATSNPLAHVSGVSGLIERIQATTNGSSPPGSAMPAQPGNRIGEILLENGAISESQLQQALAAQQTSGRKLGEELIVEGAVPAKAVAQALRGQSTASAQSGKAKELVKVDLERVDSLVETIGELVIVESMVSNAPEIRALPPHLRNYLGQFAKITRELQEMGMCMRMVPLRSEFQKMARMVRDLTRRSNKLVRVELRGEQTEMDRSMVEQIADPLVHLIRNAVDHGVELPSERAAQGKPETATIVLSASHEGGSIVIEISDDGRGINRERVLAKAISQGLVAESAHLSETQIYDLLFMPGFSTAAQVTEISGRGVGMDVVKRNIEAIRGRIITQSTPGRGTSFRLVLPLTLAIIDGMVIRCGGERFIVPTLNIIESLQPTRDMLFSIAGTHEHILVRGKSLPLIRLGDLLDVDAPEVDPTKALVIIVESMRAQVALLVDEVVMKHQVVIKTLSNELGVSQVFAGAAILSNGRVGLILNVESLVESALSRATARQPEGVVIRSAAQQPTANMNP